METKLSKDMRARISQLAHSTIKDTTTAESLVHLVSDAYTAGYADGEIAGFNRGQIDGFSAGKQEVLDNPFEYMDMTDMLDCADSRSEGYD